MADSALHEGEIMRFKAEELEEGQKERQLWIGVYITNSDNEGSTPETSSAEADRAVMQYRKRSITREIKEVH